jgi:hypothetical protein
MKSTTENLSYFLFFISLSIGLMACDGGNTGNKDTQIDSSELYDEYAYDQPGADTPETNGDLGYLEDVTTHNAVKVDVVMDNGFNWEQFREFYHTPGDQPELNPNASEDAAVGSWAQWGDDYLYQLVYRNFNDELWLQTYFQRNGDTGSTTNTNVNVLTIEGSDSLKLSQLWLNMERTARRMQDSLNLDRPNVPQ